ncbi:MAG: hypothetical protein KatS3mg010_1106 [Acidimicrobiia bacterium]|nr:MAG: hypothetical protein KatS3mg010_1106 [Acidimicrobiia bacterium]
MNAIHRAAALLSRAAAFEAPVVDVDGLQYREALQVVRVEGGVANNVVPDRCRVVVNRRYAPARALEDVLDELRALCTGAEDVEVLNASIAAPPNLGHPLVAEFVATGRLRVRPKLGWTDVARFAAVGVPACNYGPGDPDLAHTALERVGRGDLDRCRATLGTFLGLPPA